MKIPDDALRERLRTGDPLRAGTEPEDQVLARLARRITAFEPRPAALFPWRSLFVPLAASAVAAAAVIGLLSTSARRAPAPHAARRAPAAEPAATGGAAADDAETRQLQFETPGGTRVVWVLDPNLAL